MRPPGPLAPGGVGDIAADLDIEYRRARLEDMTQQGLGLVGETGDHLPEGPPQMGGGGLAIEPREVGVDPPITQFGIQDEQADRGLVVVGLYLRQLPPGQFLAGRQALFQFPLRGARSFQFSGAGLELLLQRGKTFQGRLAATGIVPQGVAIVQIPFPLPLRQIAGQLH